MSEVCEAIGEDDECGAPAIGAVRVRTRLGSWQTFAYCSSCKDVLVSDLEDAGVFEVMK